jgi:hypothetical protein
MNKNKLMEVYDKSYNDTFDQIMTQGIFREEAKKLLGIIYRETWSKLSGGRKTLEETEIAFEKVKRSHGLAFAA